MFFGGNFQLWKLHTAADYLSFFLFILAGIAVFVVAVKCMNRRRNHETAVNKVMKRLGRLGKKPSRVYKNVALKTENGVQNLDGIVLDRGGIRLVRAYGWGTKIYGKPDGEMWRREDPKRKEEFKNPLFELNAAAEIIKNALKDQGMEKIKVTPLVVFADNYQIPELYLGYGSCSATYQELKAWYKKQGIPKEAAYDVERASAAVEGLLAAGNGNT